MAEPSQRHLVQPFRALRPAPEFADDVAAPPYDVVSSDEASALAEGKPNSFLHISKPEIDLPAGTDVHRPEVYQKGGENMARLIESGVLARDDKPAYYLYRVEMGDHRQTGIVAAGSVPAYEDNLIRKHELTRPDKENDRVAQIEAVGAHTGPVFTTHKTDAELAAIMERTAGGAPDYSVEAEGSVRHTVWTIGDAGDIAGVTSAFDRLGVIYIADGHHRSAAAARVAARLRQGDAINEADPFERFLIVSFPYTEVRILDYNRIVRDLNGLSVDEFLKKISGAFEVTPVSGAAKPDQAGQFGLYVDGAWYALKIKSMPPSDLSPAEKLDISILTRALLEPVLGIGDPRVDPRIDFVGGIRGMAELERRVDGGEWAAAFALYPTSLSDLMDVADAGQVMPPKSTWFEPKLADGLISLPLD